MGAEPVSAEKCRPPIRFCRCPPSPSVSQCRAIGAVGERRSTRSATPGTASPRCGARSPAWSGAPGPGRPAGWTGRWWRRSRRFRRCRASEYRSTRPITWLIGMKLNVIDGAALAGVPVGLRDAPACWRPGARCTSRPWVRRCCRRCRSAGSAGRGSSRRRTPGPAAAAATLDHLVERFHATGRSAQAGRAASNASRWSSTSGW